MSVDATTEEPSAQERPPPDETAREEEPSDSVAQRVAALLPFAREDRASYVLSAVLATAGTLALLGQFYVIYLAIDGVVADEATGPGMYALAGAVLALLVAHHVLMAVSTLISHRAAFRTLYRLRLRIGRRLGRVPLGRVTGRRSGEIQRTLSEDVERLESFLAHAIPELVAALVVVAVTTVWMFAVDWRMALAAAACLALAVTLSGRAVHGSQALMGGYMAAMSRMNGSIVELVRAMPVVRTFNRTGDTFAEARDAIRGAADYQARWGLRFLPLFTGFFTLAAAPAVTIVPVGLLLWTNGSISTTDLLFFFVIGLGYGGPVTKLLNFTAQLTQLSYGARLVTDLEEAEVLPERERVPGPGDGTVEFDGVGFRYEGAGTEALTDVSFRASPGTVTALVGPSGAGKSTVAKLLCRFFDTDTGTVRVGGDDVRDLPFSALMSRVSFVFQDTFLFDDTVAANLRVADPDADGARLEDVCRRARAHEFVADLPEGYETRVGEQGSRLSGGQRQRLAIARALLKDTDVIVLDEATAFIDPENEVAVQEAVEALVHDRTVIVVAHRLSTITGADQILVVDGGRIVERGRHDDLVAADALYARMWRAFEATESIALGEAVHGAPTEPIQPTAPNGQEDV
ncbi:ABC transporter ATP-binding protein [Nocardiopsis valliformis]|uniref:ABC transporter ATP-binding protein n=1 Tax=Nocardiopsis valliformis TaxID=239974 RepID=UPI00034AE262|nr:ABC transporter ATP-binding protein [Nocardiopsis valliformis]